MRSTVLLFGVFLSLASCDTQIPTYSKCTLSGPSITAARGRVTSPNFPNKYSRRHNCGWSIVSLRGAGIRLTIEHLENKEPSETGNGVCEDKLQITRVNTKSQIVVVASDEVLCASNVGELRQNVYEISNPGNETVKVQITFTSDYSDELTGFSILFEALCNRTQRGEFGVITSPNYPANYPDYSNCFTTIEAPYDTTIQIDFEKLVVEKQLSCVSDYIVVSEGSPGQYGVKKTKYCASDTKTININSNIGTIQFVSDDKLAYTGFKANWKAVFPTTKPPPTTTISTSVETTAIIMKNCSYTNESILCQRWDANSPHIPKHIPAPEDRHHNFCRNPDNDNRGAWCYTTDPNKRWGYCDLDNCLPSTTVPSTSKQYTTTTTTTTTTTEKTTSTSIFTTSTKNDIDMTTAPSETVVGVFIGDPSVEKQTSDDAGSGVPWYVFVIVAIALAVIIVTVLIFVWRKRNRKAAVTISEPVTTDTVAFSQLERDDYDSRQRENTYVEIPFLGEIHDDSTARGADGGQQDLCGKGFVHLSQSKNSSVSSLDSIQFAKEIAQRRYASDAGASTSSDIDPYSVADDIGNNGAPPLPDERTKGSLRVALPSNTADNVYHSIEGQKENPSTTKPLPPPPEERSDVRLSQNSNKKKSKDWKFMKKSSRSELIPVTGFSNPSYREPQPTGIISESEDENPFDTDDENANNEASAYQIPAGIPLKDDFFGDNVYNQPATIPSPTEAAKANKLKIAKETQPHSKGDSPYMMPKIPVSNKVPENAEMICISPEVIDDKEQRAAMEHEFSLYSSPTSPVFELETIGNFTYDAPKEIRTAASSFSSSKSSDNGQADSSHDSLTKGSRDSGNASLSAIDSIPDDKQEYCVMGSVKNLTRRDKKLSVNDSDAAENRISALYLSMKGIPGERRVSEATSQATKEQTHKSRKSL